MNLSLTRITSTLGAAAVAGIAAWSSWSHMVHVALGFGERPEVAYVLPLSVDGLLIVSAAALADDKHHGRIPRWSARLAFAVGVAASLAANIAAAQPVWGARIVAGWPAVALLLTVELLSRRGRASRTVADAGLDAETAAAFGRISARLADPDADVVPVSPAPAGPRRRLQAVSPLTGRPLGGPR